MTGAIKLYYLKKWHFVNYEKINILFQFTRMFNQSPFLIPELNPASFGASIETSNGPNASNNFTYNAIGLKAPRVSEYAPPKTWEYTLFFMRTFFYKNVVAEIN